MLLFGVGYGLWQKSMVHGGAKGAGKIAFYQDSMHPWVKSDRPGKCTICAMDLTPIYQGNKGFASDGKVLILSSNNVRVLNVQTEEVKRAGLTHVLQVAGTLEGNEARKTYIASPTPGRIQSLAVEYAGVEVEQGQTLMTLYSPELVQRRAYLVSVRGDQSTLGNGLMRATTNSDPYAGDLVAPQSGVVTERNVYAGQYIEQGQRLLTIVDASVLWFRFDVYERDLAWLRTGQKLEVTTAAVPGKKFPAIISFIEPMLNEATRTVKVRADIDNPRVSANGDRQRELRFGMYADGRLKAEIPSIISVPRSAILFPGATAYTYVEKGGGAYERRIVKVGRQGGDRWEILGGLSEGDRVVVSGNVLLDAQAQFSRGSDETANDEPDSSPATPVEAPGMDSPAAGVPLNATAREALVGFVEAADGVSGALASDNLEQLQKAVLRLPGATTALAKEIGDDHPWHTLVDSLTKMSSWPVPKTLEEARKTFLPFSTKAVALIQELRGSGDDFSSLKVYHCPMAPKPGLWFQTKGPLRNPYYGAEMLTCGSEVPRTPAKPSVVAEEISHPHPNPSKSTTPVTGGAPDSRQDASSAMMPASKPSPAPTLKRGSENSSAQVSSGNRQPTPAKVPPSASKAAAPIHHEMDSEKEGPKHGTNGLPPSRQPKESRLTTKVQGQAAYGFMAYRDELQRKRWDAMAEASLTEETNGTARKLPPPAVVRAGNSDSALGVPQPKDGAVVYPGLTVTREVDELRQPFFAELRGRNTNELVKPSETNAGSSVTADLTHFAPGRGLNIPPSLPALATFLTNASLVGFSLASDDLGAFNNWVVKLAADVAPLQKELAGAAPWESARLRIESFVNGPADDSLQDARQRFLPFSTAVSEMTRHYRKANPGFAGMMVYHCPKAPSPGMWVQICGPLRNPFYGSKMPTCGEPVLE